MKGLAGAALGQVDPHALPHERHPGCESPRRQGGVHRAVVDDAVADVLRDEHPLTDVGRFQQLQRGGRSAVEVERRAGLASLEFGETVFGRDDGVAGEAALRDPAGDAHVRFPLQEHAGILRRRPREQRRVPAGEGVPQQLPGLGIGFASRNLAKPSAVEARHRLHVGAGPVRADRRAHPEAPEQVLDDADLLIRSGHDRHGHQACPRMGREGAQGEDVVGVSGLHIEHDRDCHARDRTDPTVRHQRNIGASNQPGSSGTPRVWSPPVAWPCRPARPRDVQRSRRPGATSRSRIALIAPARTRTGTSPVTSTIEDGTAASVGPPSR